MASTTTSNIIEALLLVAICLASVLGNALMFVVFLRRKQLLTISNGYLLNLAFADLLVSVLNMPVTVVTIMEQRWIFGETACDLLGFTTMLSFVSSVMSLAMIAINRYYYVVQWKTYHTIFTLRKSVLFGSTVWLLSSLISLPPLFGWADYRYIPGKSYCFVFWSSDVYYMYFMLTICFFGPLTVMSVSYFHILKFTRQSRQRVEQHREDNLKPYNSSREQENGRKIKRFTMSPEEVQITNTLLIVDVCFMVCWAPFAITMFIDVYHPNPLPRAIDIGTLLLGYANSMCNPLVYGTRNQAFRRELYRLYNDCISLCSRKSDVTSLHEVPHSGTTVEGEPELTKFSVRRA